MFLCRAPRYQQPALVAGAFRSLAVKGGFQKNKTQDSAPRTAKKPGEGRDPYALFKQAILSIPSKEEFTQLPRESWEDRQERKRQYSQKMMAEVNEHGHVPLRYTKAHLLSHGHSICV